MNRERAALLNAGLSLAAGLLFGVGLTISGMTQPRKVIAFLDFGGAWDPSLMFVMAGAVVVSAIAFHFILGRARPIVAASFAVPEKRKIDGRLLLGSAIFGVGWGLGGFCPGPAIASVTSLARSPLVFVGSMIAGMLLFEAIDGLRLRKVTRRRASLPSMPSIPPETVDDA